MQPDTLRLQGTLHEIERASRFVGSFCRTRGIEAEAERILVLILEELITNTVKHGEAPPGAPIDISLTLEDDGIHLLYRDRGRRFDPTRDLPEPDFNVSLGLRPTGGLGWPLIRYYCAAITYSREADGNLLALTVRIDTAAD